MVKGTYKFRAVGPGLDFAEWCEADRLDEVLELLTAAIKKFKNDHKKAQLTTGHQGKGER